MESTDFESIGLAEFYYKSCAGKQGYPSEAAAMTHADMLRRGRLRIKGDHTKSRDWSVLAPYRCRFCSQVHLGHPDA